MKRQQNFQSSYTKYHKYLRRYRALESGAIICKRASTKTKSWLLKKLKQLKRVIENILCNFKVHNLKRAAIVGTVPIVLFLTAPDASAQTFSEVSTSNVDVGTLSNPAFVDIDNDGDFDLFIGDYDGALSYYENTGSPSVFNYEERTGVSNPLNAVDAAIPYYSSASFVDIDDDGDFDVFIGEYYGEILYYENNGSAGSPIFTQRTGGSNPLDGVAGLGLTSPAPAFVDIDGDNDFDIFIGENGGGIIYYQNTGDETSPTFTQRTGGLNPLNGENVGTYSSPGFVDIDDDGDFDALIGETDGIFNYYENTGSVGSANFTERVAGLNPLDGEDVGTRSVPAIVDINNDGDFDMLSGAGDGTLPDFFINAGTAAAAAFSRYTPLVGVDAGTYAAPAVIDMDGDGDLDIMFGEDQGAFFYYENIGLGGDHNYIERTGTGNPMDGQDVGRYSAPEFVDIDDDGDFDLFSGEDDGRVFYYENIGTVNAPVFTRRTGAANPMDGESVGKYSFPIFVDIDDDGDWDLFIGEYGGGFFYYENTGTTASPTFVERTGGANPLNGEDIGIESAPAFIDFDKDGDFDMFSGHANGLFYYFENTGTVASPTFVERTGGANPLDAIDIGGYSQVIFGDIDSDGDADLFCGTQNGTFPYFIGDGTGISPLPIEMVYFEATKHGQGVLIEWHTASELNNDYFLVERSSDGIQFETINQVNGAGDSSGLLKYSIVDTNAPYGIVYYDIKQIDFDGAFEYSEIRIIDNTELSQIKVYPNAITNIVTVDLPVFDDGTATITVLDAHARALLSAQYSVGAGNNHINCDLSSLMPGMYFLKVTLNKSLSETHRIIKR
jgi:hypothetical protein